MSSPPEGFDSQTLLELVDELLTAGSMLRWLGQEREKNVKTETTGAAPGAVAGLATEMEAPDVHTQMLHEALGVIEGYLRTQPAPKPGPNGKVKKSPESHSGRLKACIQVLLMKVVSRVATQVQTPEETAAVSCMSSAAALCHTTQARRI